VITPLSLTERPIDTFHNEGYLVVDKVFEDRELEPFAHDITKLIDRETDRLVTDGQLSQTFADHPFETRLTRITEKDESIYWSIVGGRLATPGIFGLMTTPTLLDIAESLVGPEIIASSVYRLRPKLPGFWHGVVPWHQDSGYFEPYCDTSLILTVWIPLVDATVDRGCLELIPRAHRNDVFRHRTAGAGPDSHAYNGYLRIDESDLPGMGKDAIPVPVPRGGALLLTNRTPHRSTDNASEVIRWSMDVRFQSADLPTNYAAPSGFTNEALPDHAPDACYPPEADFLVRSTVRPQDVVNDWQTFKQLRGSHPSSKMTDRWGAGLVVGSYYQTRSQDALGPVEQPS
jgi:phytanoyl-CoA hydroxylase